MKTNYLKGLHYSILIQVAVVVIRACTGQNGRVGSEVENSHGLPQTPSLQALIDFVTLFHDFGTIIEGKKVILNVIDNV